jgi:hypothetical protein
MNGQPTLKELSESHRPRHKEYLAFGDHLTRWRWEWWITLTFEPGISYFPADRIFTRWRLRLVDQEDTQLAGFRVTRSKKHLLHMHMLAFGRNREGKTLLDCSTREWEIRWPYHATIKRVYDNARICDYLAKHVLGFLADHYQIDPCNDRLLLRNMDPDRNRPSNTIYDWVVEPEGPCIGGPDDCLDLE